MNFAKTPMPPNGAILASKKGLMVVLTYNIFLRIHPTFAPLELWQNFDHSKGMLAVEFSTWEMGCH
ncbi:hypothetical protein N9Z47_00940 [bacterium]|jgi:hypothetical protein|nr:hypothetical protein [bacterium]MDA7910430.1 hypothetical protein [bacterium]MDB4385906.1 hypothetical protein [bacterium]MDC3255788.1 hypothetical protein [bacterium]